MSAQLFTNNGQLFLTDGGLETDMIFNRGLDLPEFAAFLLLTSDEGKQHLREYYEGYLMVAKRHKQGFVLDSPTWRASLNWGALLGFDELQLQTVNYTAIELLKQLKNEYEDDETPIIVSGQLGPMEDGYSSDKQVTAEESERYHFKQIRSLKDAGAEMITVLTMNYADEAIGIVRACQKVDLPVVVSFTTETDGKIPSGHTLKEAIQLVDIMTDNYTSYFMINCSHPDHFINDISSGEEWTKRIKGLRANASSKSHEELDNSEVIDSGNKLELASKYKDVKKVLPELTVIGGCCGTDHTHVEEIIAQL